MGAAYFNGFDAFIIDADGIRIPLADETFDVEVVGGSSLDPVDSDAFGYIASAELSGVSVGDVVEFSHSSYPETFRRTLAATVEEAELLPANYLPGYVAEDLSAHREPVAYDVWVRDQDKTDAVDQKVGTVAANTAAKFPLQNIVNTDFRVFLHPILGKQGETSVLHYDDSPFADIAAMGRPGSEDVPANHVYAGPPSGGDDTPTFRALVAADIPSLDATKIATGTFGHARLGSGGGGSTKFLREDSTWQTIAAGISIGSAVSGGGANRVLYQDGSQNLAASSNFTYNGTDLSVSNGGFVASGDNKGFDVASGYGYFRKVPGTQVDLHSGGALVITSGGNLIDLQGKSRISSDFSSYIEFSGSGSTALQFKHLGGFVGGAVLQDANAKWVIREHASQSGNPWELQNSIGTALASFSASGNLNVPSIELGHASDTTLTRSSAGNLAVEGNIVYRAGGTDVPVTDGGTGASTAAGARTNLDLDAATRTIENKTANYTVTAADHNKIFTNVGTSGNITFTLPAISGCTSGRTRYSFANLDAGAFRISIQVNGSDHLYFVNSGSTVDVTGGSSTNDGSVVGSWFTVELVGGDWIASELVGSWS